MSLSQGIWVFSKQLDIPTLLVLSATAGGRKVTLWKMWPLLLSIIQKGFMARLDAGCCRDHSFCIFVAIPENRTSMFFACHHIFLHLQTNEIKNHIIQIFEGKADREGKAILISLKSWFKNQGRGTVISHLSQAHLTLCSSLNHFACCFPALINN